MYPDHQHPAGSYAWAERIRRLFHNEIWNIGVVDQTLADIVVRGLVEPPRWLPSMPPGRMLADPACRQHEDGSRTLYAEYLDYRRNLGEIWSAYVAPGADPTSARFSPLLARDHHMSYPFPFVDENGRTLLTAETWQAEQAFLWVHEHARDLRAAGTLMPDGRSSIRRCGMMVSGGGCSARCVTSMQTAPCSCSMPGRSAPNGSRTR